MIFEEYVGRLIDRGKTNSQILDDLLKKHEQGKIQIPALRLFAFERMKVSLDQLNPSERAQCIENINELPPTFVEELPWIPFFRQILQSPALDEHGQPSEMSALWNLGAPKWIKAVFPTEKQRYQQELRILDDEGAWSEEGFQRSLRCIKALDKQGYKPRFERLRLCVHGYLDPDGRIRKRLIPFVWMLEADGFSGEQVRMARKIAGMMLSKGVVDRPVAIGETITAVQVRHIERVSHWLYPKYPNPPGLDIVRLFGQKPPDNWPRFEQSLIFINENIRKDPDFELLRDWLNGEVDLRGRGRARANLSRAVE